MQKYRGFTLVELLIVMGILAILMAIGISVGRFALQRANNIQHNDAADQLSLAIQAFYTDNREYPSSAQSQTGATVFGSFSNALSNDEVLGKYIDSSFDGGSDATYYYFGGAGSSPQTYLVCVSYSENGDTAGLGGYCTGTGFGELPSSGPITKKGSMSGNEFKNSVDGQCSANCVKQNYSNGAFSGSAGGKVGGSVGVETK